MNIFKEMVLSVYSYGSYKQFLQNKKGKVFGFGVMLMVIYFVVTALIPGLTTIFSPSGGMHNLMENIPDFELKNGRLWVDDVFEMDEGSIYVYIDTDPDYYFYDADEMAYFLNDYTSAILMDSEKMIVKSNGQVQGLYFSDLGGDLDKEDLMALLPLFYISFAVGIFLGYIFATAFFFFGVLLVALLGMIVASSLKYQLTFGQLYLLGVYSRTLPLIIKALVSLLPINIPFFWVINFGLSVLILFLAIRKMKEEQPPQQFMGSGPYMGPGPNMGPGSNMGQGPYMN